MVRWVGFTPTSSLKLVIYRSLPLHLTILQNLQLPGLLVWITLVWVLELVRNYASPTSVTPSSMVLGQFLLVDSLLRVTPVRSESSMRLHRTSTPGLMKVLVRRWKSPSPDGRRLASLVLKHFARELKYLVITDWVSTLSAEWRRKVYSPPL